MATRWCVLALLALVAVAAGNQSPPDYRALTVETRMLNGKAVDFCTSAECTLTAATIIEAMDPSVDPCEDFFQFACGGFIEKNPIPDDESRWSQFSVLDAQLLNALITILTEPVLESDPLPINQAKWYYSACIDVTTLETEGVTPLEDLLIVYGGWPITMSNWDSTAFDWQEAVAAATRDLYINALIGPWVFADEKSTNITALYIDQPSLGMPRSVLTDPENYADRVDAYKNYIKSTATIIASSLGESFDDSHYSSSIDSLVEFEMAVAALTTPSEDRRDVERMYNPMTVAELQDLTPGPTIDWVAFLSSLFADSGITIDSTSRVIVQEIQYLQGLADLLSTTEPEVVSNYILWRYVMSVGDDTNNAMRTASFEYNQVANGVTAQSSRQDQCSGEANDMLGMALGVPYVERYFSEQAKNESNFLVEDLRAAFKDLLDVNEWMDEETKPLALEKADYISKFIGYPDWYDEPNGLEDYFVDLTEIMDSSTHFTNVLATRKWTSGEELEAFGQPSDHTRWVMSPTIVNAYYMPEYNSITFPAGILQPPFYRANTLQAINYGGIGHVMGHEITHGFDDEGSQYDKFGNAIPWWTNATQIAFDEKAQCIIDQYNNFRVPEIDYLLPNASVNGINTQGENIADNGGLREAYLAYQRYVSRYGEEPYLPGLEQYTPNQLFFLGNANIWCTAIKDERLLNQILTDPHSPERFRVLGPMSNMEQFSQEWSCPAGSPMNPDNKCIVW